MLTEKTAKNRKNYSCEVCDFITSDKKDYTRHCSTRKHISLTKSNNSTDQKTDLYVCSKCGKEYKSKQGLWSHNKTCISRDNIQISNTSIIQDDILSSEPIKNYIMKLVEQNMQLSEQTNELKNMFIQQNAELHEKIDTLVEQPPQQITNIHKTTNNQFNLNVFLQQTCKDAINMSDFIDSLEINTKSLERTGTHGYVHGISKIFMDGIRKLKVQERPIHCTDLKREVLYITPFLI